MLGRQHNGSELNTARRATPVRTDQPSTADETALREASAEQPGDRAVLLRRLERLPRWHPSSPAADRGSDEAPEGDEADGTESVAGSRARLFEAMAESAGSPAAITTEANQQIGVQPAAIGDTLGGDAGDAGRVAEAEDSALQHADADPCALSVRRWRLIRLSINWLWRGSTLQTLKSISGLARCPTHPAQWRASQAVLSLIGMLPTVPWCMRCLTSRTMRRQASPACVTGWKIQR